MAEDKTKTGRTTTKRTTAKVEEKKRPTTTKTKKGGNLKNDLKKFRIIFASLMFCCSVYLAITLFCHLFNWQSDQLFSDLSMVKDSDIEAKNACGPYGAYIGNVVIGGWLGIAGILLPIPFLAISIFMLNISFRFLIKLTISTIGGILILPATISTILPFNDLTIFGNGYGGGYGNYISALLTSTIGIVGAIIVLLFASSIWLIYSFPYSFRWYVALSHLLKNSATKIGDKINEAPKAAQKPVKENAKKEESLPKLIENSNIEEFENDLPENIINEPENIKVETEEHSPITLKVNSPESNGEVDNKNSEQTIKLVVNEPVEDVVEVNEDENKKENIDIKVSITDSAVVEDAELLEKNHVNINSISEIDDNEFDQSIFDPTKELSKYKLPPLTLLDDTVSKVNVTQEELNDNTRRIVETLENFNIKIQGIEATIGPTVTLYEIKPAPGVRISTIKRLEDDIALSLSALGIRIIAPIPGKDTIGIEVPNKKRENVTMYSVIKSTDFQNSDAELPIVLGKTIQNKPYVVDLAKMPHLLVAGATGQGKSVGLNAIITSLLYKKHPAELKFVMVDPKKVEFSLYSSLEKHYLAKLPDEDEAIITDTQKVIHTLNSLCIEMDSRYELLKKAKVRNIKEYNEKFKERRLNPNNGHHFLPYFVVVIDEFGDLILTAGKEVEAPLTRLAAVARAVGIHLVIATQRPTTNIITGSIKANFPARMAFRVISGIDSKTILDSTAASQLIGKGDMLIIANNDTTRVQCAFIDTPEVERITDFIHAQVGFGNAYALPEYNVEIKGGDSEDEGRTVTRDALFDKVARYVVTNQQGSASTIQRNFEIGFNRAGRIMDQLEKARIVGKQQGSKPRQVLIEDLTSLEIHLINIDSYNR